ncbi:uncharacterized protein LOC142575141 [Dermacentor variabilis]|uniref:uncharacterized protein LOC142575141 n=1 Tax=Dermacentor variabilis TaxID=34621 RepID=UPI003F5CA89C
MADFFRGAAKMADVFRKAAKRADFFREAAKRADFFREAAKRADFFREAAKRADFFREAAKRADFFREASKRADFFREASKRADFFREASKRADFFREAAKMVDISHMAPPGTVVHAIGVAAGTITRLTEIVQQEIGDATPATRWAISLRYVERPKQQCNTSLPQRRCLRQLPQGSRPRLSCTVSAFETKKDLEVPVVVNGVSMRLLVDTGASVSFMTAEDFRNHFGQQHWLSQTTVDLRNYSRQRIDIQGLFRATVQFFQRSCSVTFHVTTTGTSLLGLDAI